jgi:hypothetical protein
MMGVILFAPLCNYGRAVCLIDMDTEGYHSASAIAMFVFGCAIVSLLATAMLKDNTNRAMCDD